ncbi:MAG: sodium:solute symporter family protein [Spirochaetes bacterium]|nr:sodium:solute symporter family protein [Spirochaetota bacterium]
MNTLIVLSVLGIWFAAGCLISYFAKRKTGRGLTEYFIANRKIGGFIAAMTYSATTYSSFMMIGLVGMTYAVGVGAFGFEITYLVSTVLLLLYFAPKFWELGKRYDVISPAELLRKYYGSAFLGKFITIYSFLMLIPYMSVQFTGIGYLLKGLAGIPYVYAVLIALIIILTFTLWAGMRSVAWTDTLQAFIMFVSSVILVLFLIRTRFNGFSAFFGTLEREHTGLLSADKIPYMKFIGLSIPWMFFALTNPQVSQRMFIARDRKSLKNMILGFAVFGFLYTIIVVNLGFIARSIFPAMEKGDTITSLLLTNVPVILALFVFTGIVAASVSTVNSIALTLGSMFAVDFSGGQQKHGSILFGKAVILIITITAFVFSLGRFNVIVELSVMSSAGLLATAPSYIGLFWKKSSKNASIVSTLIGGIVTVVLYSTGWKPLGLWPGVWTGIVSAAIFVLMSLAEYYNGGVFNGKQEEKGIYPESSSE